MSARLTAFLLHGTARVKGTLSSELPKEFHRLIQNEV